MTSQKTAIIQCADTGPVESLAVMLNSVGYVCRLPDEELLDHLRSLGLDTVLSIRNLVRGWGYEPPDQELFGLPVGVREFHRLAELPGVLYVDVKAHRNGPRLWKSVPKLQGKTLWYRINGGKPEHVVRKCDVCRRRDHVIRPTIDKMIDEGVLPKADYAINYDTCLRCEDCGDEVNPPCPVLTPNQWYNSKAKWFTNAWTNDPRSHQVCDVCGGKVYSAREMFNHKCPWEGRAYTCWPPFNGIHRYNDRETYDVVNMNPYDPPICLIHNLQGWGYSKIAPELADKFGVRCYGAGSPNGLLNHREVPLRLSKTIANVHLKSNDCPGYSIYETLASGCPLIVSRRLIWRSKLEALLEPDVTCLAFDRPTHDPISDVEAVGMIQEIGQALKKLSNRDYNRSIGQAGRRRLQELMWSASNPEDVQSLDQFMQSNF